MADMSSPPLSACIEPSRDEVVARLQQTDATEMLAKLPALPASVIRAAVLLPLFYHNSRLHILLTVRSSNLKHHRGEVAFPGGKWDGGDVDFKATAVRETEEEVGLPRGRVQVVSQLGPTFARRGTLVVPVVGFIPEDFNPIPNPAEVQDVFSVPLFNFLRSEGHIQRNVNDGINSFTISFFSHSDERGKHFTIFGLTASICILAASVCYARSAEFETSIMYDRANPRQILQMSHDSYMRQVKKLKETKQQGKL